MRSRQKPCSIVTTITATLHGFALCEVQAGCNDLAIERTNKIEITQAVHQPGYNLNSAHLFFDLQSVIAKTGRTIMLLCRVVYSVVGYQHRFPKRLSGRMAAPP